MCGRFTLHGPESDLKSFFEVDDLDQYSESFNIAPGHDLIALRLEAGEPQVARLNWGLVPSWAKDRSIAYKTTNARSETAAEKASFREALGKRRCIIPATGYYEWKRVGKEKQPYYIKSSEQPYLAFAGLWERWVDSDGSVLESCTVLTTEAHQSLAWLHHRMPVLLGRDKHLSWLKHGLNDTDWAQLSSSACHDTFQSHPVSQRMNRVENDDRACIVQCEAVVAENLELF